MTADSSHFYEHIPALERYEDVFQANAYHPFPGDWYVAVSDIKNSTVAIQEGRYREVNIIGVAPIIGILNKTPSPRVPFLFGGDGMMVCIPPDSVELVNSVLERTKEIAKADYGMHLRTAVFPLSDFFENGKSLSVAKYSVSEFYKQAYFSGTALTVIDQRLKSPDLEKERPKKKNSSPKEAIQYDGLECRWKSVPSSLGVTLTLIAQSLHSDPDLMLKDYEELISFLNQFKTSRFPPIEEPAMKMYFNPMRFKSEAKLRTFGLRWYQKVAYYFQQPLLTLIGFFMMKFKVETDVTQWGRYTTDMVQNSDYRKMDSAYRHILSCTQAQANEIEEWLENKWKDRSMAFGIHQSDSSLVTCMVFAYQQEHIHFVDGNHGGYALAAKALKQRLEEK